MAAKTAIFISVFFSRVLKGFSRSAARLITGLTVRMARFIEKNSQKDWERLVMVVAGTEGVKQGSQAGAYYRPNKTIGLEIGHSKGSSVDVVSHQRILPRWAEEIQPFLQNQLSRHTRRAYETDLKQFLAFLDGRILPNGFTDLRAEHVIAYRKHLEEGRGSGKPMAPTSVNRKLAVIKSFFNWLKINQVASENPASLVKGFPQNQESALKGLTDEEAAKILSMPSQNSRSGALHSAILHVLFFLGLRKGELIGLRVGDLDSERGVRVLRVRGKGHRVRILPITAKVEAVIERYFSLCGRSLEDKEAPLFSGTRNPRSGQLGRPLNPHSVTYLVQRYSRRAGVLKRISPHSCRATCISNALDRRATHRSVQHLAGWSTPLMIQRYDKRREDLKNSAAYLIEYESPVTA